MIKKSSYTICLILISMFLTGTLMQPLNAQDPGTEVTGVVIESGTGNPLAQVAISVAATGTTVISAEDGTFTLEVPDLQAEIIADIPGYIRRSLFLNGRTNLNISMVSDRFMTQDNPYTAPTGSRVLKDAVFPANTLRQSDLQYTPASSFDQALQGRIPGLQVTEQSGMPGHRTKMNIRGYSSLYANSEPLLFIDGMIHSYSYAMNGLMEGYALNPMDVVDINDISDISVMKDGNAYLGALSSNGVIYVNTEQKAEASTVIKFAAYGGLSLAPKSQELLNPEQFTDYFRDALVSAGETEDMYPWLNGSPGDPGYYKYHNDTDWQDEIYNPSMVSKFHFFLKGGDDIATYNVSTGYLSHNGILENSSYTRFNLRINGKVNITDRFSITPNAKLSLADSKVANHGPSTYKNPMASALMKAPIMDPIARDDVSGEYLTYYDDVGDLGVSNPAVLVNKALGESRNYHFLASMKAEYRFNEHFNLSTLFGLNFNNLRESRFLPDHGVVSPDSIYNSPGEFVNDFRSTQNHTQLTYTSNSGDGHSILANVGFRYMADSYKFNKSISLNTPSDEFKKIQDNAKYPFLRTTIGDDREIVWLSYFADAHYNFKSKYYLSASLSYDGSSVTNKNNRYNFYPSVGAAWRLSSEGFLTDASWLEDLRLRASYSITGNMFSTVYDYSKLYYADRRINGYGVLTREAIPNEDLELEKKNTINAGIDLSVFNQSINLHADYFMSSVNNLIVKQDLPAAYGYTEYYDNGGKLSSNGFEVGFDAHLQSGDFIWSIGGTVSKVLTTVNSLEFINPLEEHIITSFPGGEFITEVDGPVNAYHGYVTDGLISQADVDAGMTGPTGLPVVPGDVKYVDQDGVAGITEADKTNIGDPNPDLFGSLFTSFTWRNFELYVRADYSLGGELYNHMRKHSESMSDFSNQSTTVLKRWTPTHTDRELPRLSYGDPTGNTLFSDRWIEDGSYLKLAQLTLNYTLPQKEGLFKGLTIYVTATNLLTLTSYSGYDPEFAFMNNPFIQGVDYGLMPGAKTFIIGLKLDL